MKVKLRRYEELQKKLFTKEELAEDRRWAVIESRKIDLREIRRLAKLTQKEVAQRMGIDQSELSRCERRDDHKLSTLARVVAAMGGSLELVVEIGSVRYRLTPGAWMEEATTLRGDRAETRELGRKRRRAAA